MTTAPTATKVLDGFLVARAGRASPEGLELMRAVVGRLAAYVEMSGTLPVDDLTARRLSHDGGREPTEHELAAVLAVIERVPGFFKSLGADELQATRSELARAALVIRDLAGWLVHRRLIDADVAAHLDRYTHLYDADSPRTGT